MDGLSIFHDHVADCLARFVAEERDSVERAAQALAAQLQAGRVIHGFGPGVHSFIGVEEMFFRKGGLIPVRPYFAVGLSGNAGARCATKTEGNLEFADLILAQYGLTADDVLVIFNAYGFNACAVQSAIRAKEIGATVIALTAPAYSREVPENQPNRHPSKRLLCDIADVVVDIKMVSGETVVPVENLPGKAGGTATILHGFAWNAIVIRTAEILGAAGQTPPVWVVERPEHNAPFIEQYAQDMRHY